MPVGASKSEDRRLRAARPAKPVIDPWRPIDVQLEDERAPEGHVERSLTIFLAGRECPFTCVFCDLWQHTTDTPTPPGAIPEQIRRALEQVARRDARRDTSQEALDTVKLYNASNFFDQHSVPAEDDAEIAHLVKGFGRVVVECHAKLIGERCRRFAARVPRLEVAIGFETVHPQALERLNKRVDVADLRRAGARLRAFDVDLRAFVLIGAPFVPAGEELLWLARSVELALESGARIVSLIPLRGGEGELARLERSGQWRAPDLDQVETSFEHARGLSPERVRLDTWDLERLAGSGLASSSQERADRIARLRRLQIEPGARRACQETR